MWGQSDIGRGTGWVAPGPLETWMGVNAATAYRGRRAEVKAKPGSMPPGTAGRGTDGSYQGDRLV